MTEEKIQRLEEENASLREVLEHLLPHKRLARNASLWGGFFVFCLITSSILHVIIVTPFWAILGVLICIGFLTVSYAMHRDWEKDRKHRE